MKENSLFNFKKNKNIKYFFAGIVLVILIILIYCFINFTGLMPDKSDIKLPGLSGKVKITRDQYGIAHIEAEKSDLDAFFGLGYVHAQDRLWQMIFNQHVVSGTLSELFGAKTVIQDEYLHTWGFYRSAKASWPFLSPAAQAIIQSYTNGVNAYINTHQHHLPLQFTLLHFHPQPWTVIDTIAWQKILAWDLQDVWKSKLNNYRVEKNLGAEHIAALFPPYPLTAPSILSDQDLKQNDLYNFSHNNSIKKILFQGLTQANSADKGSNNWVVSGKWTTSGKPLLANDPHLRLQSPSLWYLAQIKGPHINVIGATIPGTVGVVIGHNDTIAWGVTNVNPDTQELYILSKTNIALIKSRIEIIKVRHKPSINYKVMTFNNMPIISQVTPVGEISPYIALKWPAFDNNDTTVQSLLEINTAQNWNEFVNALKSFVTPSQNFIYADIKGNIGYYLPGRIPIRDYNSNLPVPYDKLHQWQGYIPFEKLPHVYNPPQGYIASANNLPVSNHYPYALNFRWSVPPYRIERIIELLNKYRPLTIDKFKAIQLDNYSTLWQALSGSLLKTSPFDPESRLGLDYLKNWNGNTDINSIASTIFAYWYRELDKLMPDFLSATDKYPEPLFLVHTLNFSSICIQQFLTESLEHAMHALIKDHGNNPKNWVWGKTHQAVLEELGFGTIPILGSVWNRKIETPGGLYTVNPGTYNPVTFKQNNGASYRQIIDLNNLNNSLFIQTLGQSDNFLSKHYQDQLQRWQKGQYLSMSTDARAWKNQKILILEPS